MPFHYHMTEKWLVFLMSFFSFLGSPTVHNREIARVRAESAFNAFFIYLFFYHFLGSSTVP
jgi:hypothetical protein